MDPFKFPPRNQFLLALENVTGTWQVGLGGLSIRNMYLWHLEAIHNIYIPGDKRPLGGNWNYQILAEY